ALGHFRRKDYPRALRAMRDAYALDPHNAEITNNLAFLYERLGNPAEAERNYRETLRLDPNRAVAYLNLADLLSRKGATQERLAEAAELLTKARELEGNRAGIILRQARLAAARGRFEEGERFFREYAASRKPSD